MAVTGYSTWNRDPTPRHRPLQNTAVYLQPLHGSRLRSDAVEQPDVWVFVAAEVMRHVDGERLQGAGHDVWSALRKRQPRQGFPLRDRASHHHRLRREGEHFRTEAGVDAQPGVEGKAV